MVGFFKFGKFLVAILLAQILMVNAASAKEEPMQFWIDTTEQANFRRMTLNGGKHEIFAAGTIDSGASLRLSMLVTLNQIDHAIVYFDSPGGSLSGGIELGRTIRKLGFETGVKSANYQYEKGPLAFCASACAYAFAGGTARFYDDQVGKLGLHQFYANENVNISAEDAQFTSGYLIEYLDEMGVSGKAFSLASKSSRNEMTWLTNPEAEEVALANNGIEPTVAEIKLSDGKPYLRIQQNFNDVTSRVLIMCDDQNIVVMGGIVTTPAVSNDQSSIFSISYLEFGVIEYGRILESKGFSVSDSTIWIEREIPRSRMELLTQSDSMGMWLENGGALRWGSFLNLKQVRPQIKSFLENCIL